MPYSLRRFVGYSSQTEVLVKERVEDCFLLKAEIRAGIDIVENGWTADQPKVDPLIDTYGEECISQGPGERKQQQEVGLIHHHRALSYPLSSPPSRHCQLIFR